MSGLYLFLKSIIFKFQIQKTYNDIYKLEGIIKYIPEAGSVVKKLNIFKFLTNSFFVSLFIFLWPIFFNPILSVFKFVFNLIVSIFYKRKNLPDNIYLNLSDSKFFNFIETNKKNYPNAVIQSPFYKKNLNENFVVENISLYEITSIIHLCKAFIFSFISPFYFIYKGHYKLISFTYTSFSWYWLYFTINENSLKSIWFSNHYDQWTYLFDNFNNIEKKYLIQHGNMEYYDNSNDSIVFPNFKDKLMQIDKIFVINDESINYFKKYINNKKLQFEIIDSKLSIKKWPKNFISTFKILLIGHENEIKFHRELIVAILNNHNEDIAYKLHPRQFTTINNLPLWVISDREVVPDVDIVISYGSTLDNEIRQILPNTRFIRYNSSPNLNHRIEINKILYALRDHLNALKK
jgi:hypothetical protein